MGGDDQRSMTFYLENSGSGYHGTVEEDERVVNVTPPIMVGGSEMVCGFSIVKNHRKHHDEVPFEVRL